MADIVVAEPVVSHVPEPEPVAAVAPVKTITPITMKKQRVCAAPARSCLPTLMSCVA